MDGGGALLSGLDRQRRRADPGARFPRSRPAPAPPRRPPCHSIVASASTTRQRTLACTPAGLAEAVPKMIARIDPPIRASYAPGGSAMASREVSRVHRVRLCLAIGSLLAGVSASAAPLGAAGDADGSGKVDILDAVRLLRAIVGIEALP